MDNYETWRSRLKIKEKSKYWLDLSDYDFETAEAMLAGGRFLYVGFMCHQTIGKILKARYPTHKEQLLKSLTRTKCEEILIKTKELQSWVKERL